MEWKRYYLLGRGYFFLARHKLAGKVVDILLNILGSLDYRIGVYLSMWHPDFNERMKWIKKRGVQIADTAGVDIGVFIEYTHPQSVIIEDYAGIGYGTSVIAHDAGMNSMMDMPMRVKETRIGYNTKIGYHCVIMPGVTIGRNCGVLAGAVVTKDVPDGSLVAGNPAKVIARAEDIVMAFQEDMKVHPELYYDHPNEMRPPSSPFDHLLTWRQQEPKIQNCKVIRTGTPFDYILDAKAMKEAKDAQGGRG